jgi:hypothetical protein
LCGAANFTHNKSADKGIKIEPASFFLGMMNARMNALYNGALLL